MADLNMRLFNSANRHLMIYVFNWIIIVNAMLNRIELLIALVFTLPMAWYMGKVCLHDINMPQRVQWYPFFGRYFIFLNGKLSNGNTQIKMNYHLLKILSYEI